MSIEFKNKPPYGVNPCCGTCQGNPTLNQFYRPRGEVLCSTKLSQYIDDMKSKVEQPKFSDEEVSKELIDTHVCEYYWVADSFIPEFFLCKSVDDLYLVWESFLTGRYEITDGFAKRMYDGQPIEHQLIDKLSEMITPPECMELLNELYDTDENVSEEILEKLISFFKDAIMTNFEGCDSYPLIAFISQSSGFDRYGDNHSVIFRTTSLKSLGL